MTNTALVRQYEKIQAQMSKLSDKLIDAGLGHLRPSDMRAKPDAHPLVSKWIELADKVIDLRYEAERRYGPGLINVNQLRNVK